MEIRRSDSNNTDFIQLVKQLDAYLTITDGDDHDFYHQYNNIDVLRHVILIYENDKAIACGAMKAYGDDSMEVKRMYTLPEMRGQGFAATVLTELEKWAKELNKKRCILETGKRQTEAVIFYEKRGYQVIPNFDQYVGVENSICFAKTL